jgi:hypothetical protein
MLHPIGEQPPSIYWRRRVAVLAVVALAFLTMYAVLFRGSDGKNKLAGSPSGHKSVAPPVTPVTSPDALATSPAPVACVASQLTVAAETDAKSYPVGAKPTLSLLVTNSGPGPCVADLSDQQIELRVLSGGARVWDSHDCAVQPGTSLQTLPVGTVVRRGIAWSGLTSEPGCAGQRQRAPAGSYSLIAIFSGLQSAPAPFTLTG